MTPAIKSYKAKSWRWMTLILAEDLRRRRMAASVTSSAGPRVAQSSLRAESRKGENVRITGSGFCGILNRSWILNRACCTGTRKGGPGGRTIIQPNQEPFYYFHPCFSLSQSASVTWVSPAFLNVATRSTSRSTLLLPAPESPQC